MNSIAFSLAFLAAMLVASALGMLLRRFLPQHHLTNESNDAVLRAVGLVVTLSALVLGFLVNSANSYYHEVSSQLKQIGANVAVLDRDLERFGPDGAQARILLRQSTGAAVRLLWPHHVTPLPPLSAGRPFDGLERLEVAVQDLPAPDEPHRYLKEQALAYTAGIEHDSLLLGDLAATRLQLPLLLIMLSWLVIVFVGFGLVWPRTGQWRPSPAQVRS